MTGVGTTPELFHFAFSHFNEKARWALDYKRVPHRRHAVLPGPHLLSIRRLSGQTAVPVLRCGADVIPGSGNIIDYLERTHPDPPLYPEAPGERERALEIQLWFDEEVGPQIRRAIFHALLPDGAYATRLFTTGRGELTRFFYRGIFPGIRRFIRQAERIEPDAAERGRERTRAALDFVAKTVGPEGYLVGERFSVADLTAASLLFLVVFPPGIQFELPRPRSQVVDDWLADWADHPGTAWVSEMYRRHRGTSAELRAR